MFVSIISKRLQNYHPGSSVYNDSSKRLLSDDSSKPIAIDMELSLYELPLYTLEPAVAFTGKNGSMVII
jgi:hypothetical protein